jgi:hypothetical protein
MPTKKKSNNNKHFLEYAVVVAVLVVGAAILYLYYATRNHNIDTCDSNSGVAAAWGEEFKGKGTYISDKDCHANTNGKTACRWRDPSGNSKTGSWCVASDSKCPDNHNCGVPAGKVGPVIVCDSNSGVAAAWGDKFKGKGTYISDKDCQNNTNTSGKTACRWRESTGGRGPGSWCVAPDSKCPDDHDCGVPVLADIVTNTGNARGFPDGFIDVTVKERNTYNGKGTGMTLAILFQSGPSDSVVRAVIYGSGQGYTENEIITFNQDQMRQITGENVTMTTDVVLKIPDLSVPDARFPWTVKSWPKFLIESEGKT